MIAQNTVSNAAHPRTSANEWRSSIAPVAAPINIITIDPTFLGQRRLLSSCNQGIECQPNNSESEAVVVRSGTASLRTVPLRMPILKAAKTIRLFTVETSIG